MIRTCVFLFLLAFVNSRVYADSLWKILDREAGCVPLDLIYQEYPYLIHIKSPNQIFHKIKSKFSDTKFVPIVDVVAWERVASKDAATKEEITFFKHFTRNNALQISSKKGGIELNFVKNELCANLMFSEIMKSP